MKTVYVYPAVFEEKHGAVSVIFPDLGIATSGDDVADAIVMARDELCLTLYDMEELKAEIPEPTHITEVPVTGGQFVALIECDTMEYRNLFSHM